MCGRFTVTVSHKSLQEAFPLFELPDFTPRFNIAPTQPVLAVRHEEGKEKPQGVFLRWGLVPSWADDLSIGNRLINARADGVAQKPAFRAAFKKRRCLILADGFYEWKKGPKPKDPKQPFHIRLGGGQPFAFAGLWEHWEKREEPVETCTIITTGANEAIAPLHDRMPVILERRDYARWLDPTAGDPQTLLEMLRPYRADEIETIPVTTRINNPRFEPGTRAELVEGKESAMGLNFNEGDE